MSRSRSWLSSISICLIQLLSLIAYSISKSKLTMSASPCRIILLSAARLRVIFDLVMELNEELAMRLKDKEIMAVNINAGI
ncbi:hypothetical protein SAMN05421863_10852 [Nitrosomonas communis]|uniref:Uncharacterized protein n=1 Tax=Nitrosomonas communis TaxID=44574 RepID=A0A1I4VJI8_9PROT|nr:hypothetical protein SAMN05421863_10852 [Nitrosomonas communis]